MSGRPRGVLLDLDGVLYQAARVVPGAHDVLAWLASDAIPHAFLTNTTSRPRSAIVNRLADMGLMVDAARILTPPVAAVRWLAREAPGPVALFVPPATAAEFSALPRLDDAAEMGASAVVLGDLGESWDFATLNRAFRLLMAAPAPALVALGMTRYWRGPSGLQLDVAPFVVALEHATGRQAVVLGKPARPFFEAALELVGLGVGEVVMVGDDIVGDVQGAQRAGLRGLLVRTGKYRPEDLDHGITCDGVLDSIADLPRWWEQAAAEPG